MGMTLNCPSIEELLGGIMSPSWEVRSGKDGIYYLEKRIAVPTLSCDLHCSWTKFQKGLESSDLTGLFFIFGRGSILHQWTPLPNKLLHNLSHFDFCAHNSTESSRHLCGTTIVTRILGLPPFLTSPSLPDATFHHWCPCSTQHYCPGCCPCLFLVVLNILASLGAQFNINEHLLLSKLDAPSCRSAHRQTVPSSDIRLLTL